ncbi:MAG: nitroreductase family protein [Oscillospiraceae bacterium]|jgi:nitroreductase|nr:nitroreductase family protein [Oscillospiraceae bacterium]
MTNLVIDAIHSRRSTRAFTEEQIPDEHLHALLDVAVWASSGSNSQSWLFTAIQNKDIMMKLNQIVREGFMHRYEPDDDYPGKVFAKTAAQNEKYNFYYHAPTFIIASNVPDYANAMADCALGMENIFLAAESLGLGSCYINQVHWMEHDEILRNFLAELGIPKEHTICASASIGYIAKPTVAQERKPNTVKIVR